MTGTMPRPTSPVPASGPDRAVVGRGAELGRLHEVVDGLRRGRSARVLLTGEPGVGTTALADAFCSQLEGDPDGVVVVRAAATDPARRPPTHAVVDLLARALDELVVPARPTSGRSALALHDAVTAARDATGRRRPVVLALHDLHFVDPASATVLADLVGRLHLAGVLVLASASDPEPGGAWWPRLFVAATAVTTPSSGPEVEVRTIPLGGLDAASASAFVATRRPSAPAPAPAVVSQLVARTGGHPVRLEVLVRGLSDEMLSGAEPLGLPHPFDELVHDRLDAADGSAGALIRALSVVHGPARLAVLGKVAGVPAEQAAAARAAATGLVALDVRGPRVELRFVHRLVQDAVYRGLAPDTASAMHHAAAAVLGGREGLAHAVAGAAGAPVPELATALVAAAEAENDHGEAATMQLWAAELADDGADREERLLTAAVHLVHAGDPARLRRIEPDLRAIRAGGARDLALGVLASEAGEPDAHARLEAARTHPDTTTGVRALATLRLATDHVLNGRGARAVDALEGFEALTDAPELLEAARASRTVGLALRFGAETALDSLGHLDGVFGPDLLVVAGRLHLAAGDPGAAYHRLRQGLDRMRSGASTTMGRLVHVFLAEAAFRIGRWDEAEAEARVGATTIDEVGSVWVGPAARAMCAVVLAARGAPDEAEAHIAAVRRQVPVGRPSALGGFTLRVAEAFVAHLRGDVERAYRLLGDLADGPVPALEAGPFVLWRVLLADVAIDVDRLGMAGVTVDSWPVAGVPLWFQLSRYRLTGRLAERLGDVTAAGESYRAGLDLVAAREVEAAQCPIEVAALHAAAGRLGARQGWAGTADDLARARNAFAQLGASPWADRVDAEIDRAVPGVDAVRRPPRPGRATSTSASAPDSAPVPAPAATSRPVAAVRRRAAPVPAPEPEAAPDAGSPAAPEPGPDTGSDLAALTPREREVVRLVAHGLTSREVAAALHVTPKAISYHLGNVFAKLGVTSRRQLWGRSFD